MPGRGGTYIKSHAKIRRVRRTARKRLPLPAAVVYRGARGTGQARAGGPRRVGRPNRPYANVGTRGYGRKAGQSVARVAVSKRRRVRRITEDDPRWNPRTMGNRKGTVRSPRTMDAERARRRQQLLRNLGVFVPHYDRQAKALWGRSSHFYGRAGEKMPELVVETRRGPGAAWVNRNRPNRVHVSPTHVLRAVEDPNELTVLLHEWAHSSQGKGRRSISPSDRAKVPHKRHDTEGGAEAFTHEVSPWTGLRAYRGTDDYARMARSYRRRKGRRQVLLGQFGR